MRHRQRRKPPVTATPSAYRHRASRRLYTNLVGHRAPWPGLRDRALLSVTLYSFARVSAVLGMRRQAGRRLTGTGVDATGGTRHDQSVGRRARGFRPRRAAPHVPGDGDHGVICRTGGTLEHAQQIAGHASPKTTKLYDRTADTVTVDEIERIVI